MPPSRGLQQGPVQQNRSIVTRKMRTMMTRMTRTRLMIRNTCNIWKLWMPCSSLEKMEPHHHHHIDHHLHQQYHHRYRHQLHIHQYLHHYLHHLIIAALLPQYLVRFNRSCKFTINLMTQRWWWWHTESDDDKDTQMMTHRSQNVELPEDVECSPLG